MVETLPAKLLNQCCPIIYNVMQIYNFKFSSSHIKKVKETGEIIGLCCHTAA